MLNKNESTTSTTSGTSSTSGTLIPIKKQCDVKHTHCNEILFNINKFNINVSQEYLNDFIDMITCNINQNCLLYYNNKNHCGIVKFLLKHSKTLKIKKMELIIPNLTDDNTCELIKNQMSLDDKLIDKIMSMSMVLRYCKINFLNGLLQQCKFKTIETIAMSLNLQDFEKFIAFTINKNFSFNISLTNIINKYILLKKNEFALEKNVDIGIKIINATINNVSVITNLCPLILNNINKPKLKKEIVDKIISTQNIDLILCILEFNDIVVDIDTVDKLIEKVNRNPIYDSNAIKIATIIDLLCDYGLVINKNLIIKLLEKGCYVNDLESHGISIDSEILSKCAELSYYPYKFDMIPTSTILEKECSKPNNLITIKKLKEFGGIYTTKCLELACNLNKNGKTIKYLIEECNVKVSENCLQNFQNMYNTEALDVIIKKYINDQQNKKTNNDDDSNNYFEINEKATMTVTPRNIKLNENKNFNYQIKNKIRKFLGYNKKTILYEELFELFLKYLIHNKLVIGKYFVINIELSNLLKINHCVIMNIEQIHNILTYFIDLPCEISTN